MKYRDNLHRRHEDEGYIHEKLEKDITFRRMTLKKQKSYKEKIRVLNAEYNFLQYSHMVRTWAKRNYKLTDKQLDVLLYMYPLNIFTSGQFRSSVKDMGINDYTLFKKMKDASWVNLWAKSGNKRYYVLSEKGNTLVKRMHRMCMLEEEVPMSERRNVIARSRKKKDQQLMELFGQFNEKVRNGKK